MFQYRLSHRVGRSSQATTAAVEKSGPSLIHRIQDTPLRFSLHLSSALSDTVPMLQGINVGLADSNPQLTH
jgi:hypothetical protein